MNLPPALAAWIFWIISGTLLAIEPAADAGVDAGVGVVADPPAMVTERVTVDRFNA